MKERKYSTFEVRLRAVKAVHAGTHVDDVARAYQVDRATVYRWLQKHKQAGSNEGLVRKAGSGRPRTLQDISSDQLRAIVRKSPLEFGFETDLWTCRRLREVIETEFHISVSKNTIWRRLREAGLTYQKPELKYYEACEEERQEWLQEQLPEILATVEEYNAVLYFEDESNISLNAFSGKTWAPQGQTPTQTVTGNRGGVSAMSAISKSGTLLFQLHEKRIASDEVIHFLDQILRHHKNRHVVVVMDKAPPHTSRKTKDYINSQKRLHVFYLPSYSPDWNPDEKVWNHLKNIELKGHQARTREDMRGFAERKLAYMASDPETLHRIFSRCFVAELLG